MFAFFVGNESDMNAIGARLVGIGVALALGSWFVNGFHILVPFIFQRKVNGFRLFRQVNFRVLTWLRRYVVKHIKSFYLVDYFN